MTSFRFTQILFWKSNELILLSPFDLIWCNYFFSNWKKSINRNVISWKFRRESPHDLWYHQFHMMLMIWNQKKSNFENTVDPKETWDSSKRPHGKGLSEKYKHSTWNPLRTENAWPYRLTIGFYNIDWSSSPTQRVKKSNFWRKITVFHLNKPFSD